MNGEQQVSVGLVGAGIAESLSPALHEREAALLGIDCSYRLFDLDDLGRPAADIGDVLREAQRDGLRGLNVTHPCKQLVVGELDGLSPTAAALGAVNTVVFEAGRKVGHNTDASGFEEAFATGLSGARTDRVVLVGAGGAGAAVAHAILSLGAADLAVVDADPDRAEPLVETLAPLFEESTVRAVDLSELASVLAAADGLIHATPTGMAARPGRAVPSELLEPRHWVAELVYMPTETPLLKDARDRGCRTLDGAAMVALQAAGSMELFTGAHPDRERMVRHARELFAARGSPA